MAKKKFISFGQPFLGREEIDSVKKVINSSWLGTGKITQQFEKDFSKFKKTKFAISVNSCTAALHLTLLSMNLKKTDEVITTPMTFASTINSIILSGAKPILADISKNDFNIDPKEIIKKINRNTKAILIVHFAGLPCDMSEIIRISNKYKIKIIEDCAHAIESKYKKKEVGNFGYSGCYSFYSNKNITTGEGGMLTCKDRKLAEIVKIMRLHGMTRDAWKRYMPDNTPKNLPYQHYDILHTGLKYNMIDLNAALGIKQLNKINYMWKKRKKLYDTYYNELKNYPIKLQNNYKYNFKHGYHLFLFVFDTNKFKQKNIRDVFLKYLNVNKIGGGVHYRSVTNMKNYKSLFNWNKKTCPNAYEIGNNIVSLPLYPGLSSIDQKYIIRKVKKFIESKII